MPGLSTFSQSDLAEMMVDRVRREADYAKKLEHALKVFIYCPKTVAWLEENDPSALKQARDALKED